MPQQQQPDPNTGLAGRFPRVNAAAESLLDLFLGAIGVGPETPANQAGQLVSAGLPLAGAPKAIKAAATAAKAERQGLAGIKAYHGSPHDFDQFSLAHIGKGEGAQAYGHGLYFAENPATAGAYRTNLAGRPEIQELRIGNRSIGPRNGFDYSPRGNSNYENIQSSLFEDLLIDEAALQGIPDVQKHALGILDARIKDMATEWPDGLADAQRLRADLSRPGAVKLKFGERPGKTYEVNIKADPETLLDWDAPLAAQPPKVLEALRKKFGADQIDMLAKRPYRSSNGAPMTGGEFHDAYLNGALGGAQNELLAAGIPGIRYLDGGSRSVGQGTRNLVMFDDSLIEIARKYGLLAPVAAGSLASQYQPKK
jgi:hypothetical protein